jgi:hypothetical protein
MKSTRRKKGVPQVNAKATLAACNKFPPSPPQYVTRGTASLESESHTCCPFFAVRDASTQMMTDRNGSYTGCTAPELLLKIVLAGTLSHYETRGLIDEKRLEHMLHAGKQILYKSHQESDVRQVSESTFVNAL